jgi:hypothetical protein
LNKFFEKIIKTIIKNFLIFFFSKFILFSLFYFQLIKKKKIIYSNSLGFGDNVMFYLHWYLRIKKNNLYVFQFCKQIDQPLDFFFGKNKILRPIIAIPFFIYYQVINQVKKSKLFKPSIGTNEWEKLLGRNNKDSLKNLIEIKLKNENPSSKLNFFFGYKHKYMCFFIKYAPYKNDISGSNSRATWEKEKIYNVLNSLVNKGYYVVVLGLKNDPSIKIIKEYALNSSLKDKIIFLLDISNDYSFVDQLFVAKNSSGYCGNGSGAAEIFYYLKKKALVFDHSQISYFLLPTFKKYRKTLFKSYMIDNNDKKILSEETIRILLKEKLAKYEIIDSTLEEINYEINNYLIN